MKDGNGLTSIALFSPFIDLNMSHFSHEELERLMPSWQGYKEMYYPTKAVYLGFYQ